ncbi:MAG: PDZ domain-containing protein [Planctomycetota bacterium]|nr:PDZ domain-containing protein [Planctomycetota bacterium]
MRQALVFLLLLCPSQVAIAGDEPEVLELDPDWQDLLEWRSLGPANMGGRITAIAVNPSDVSEYWIGTASGGLLHTTNAGITYEHRFDDQDSVSIGALAVAPSDPTTLWIGTGESNPRNSVSYGDGVYRSTDRGETWTHMGLEESFQVGAIAIHPTDPDTVFVGALGRLYGPNPERGLYKTTDGGETWELVLFVDERTGVIDIDLDPGDPDTLIVATYERERDGFDTNDPAKKWGPGSGLHKSTDGGESFRRLETGLPTCTLGRIGVDYFAADPKVVFAIVETEKIASLPDDAAYMGINGEDAEVGARLTKITEGGPAEAADLQEDDIVIELAGEFVSGYQSLIRLLRGHRAGETVAVEIVREREVIVVEVTFEKRPEDSGSRAPYSSGLGGQRENLQDEQGPGGGELGGVFRSDDGGDSWTRINSVNPRPMYYSEIRVDPSDAERVYVLGTALYRSSDGGVTFTSDGASRRSRGGRVHVDHHSLWIDPADGRHMILGNDGGVYVTHDRMEQWDHHNHMAIGQFYHVTTDNQLLYQVYGGLQDNGSWGGPNRTRGRTGVVNSDWINVGGGDGFVCRVDPEDPDRVYTESQNGGMGRRHLKTGERGFLRPRGERGLRFRFNWKTPFQLSAHAARVFYAAGNHVFRSVDRGENLRAISPELTLTERGSGTALSESPLDPDLLYVGTDDGALWCTEDGGESWIDLFEPYAAEDDDAPQRRRQVMEQLLRELDADGDGRLVADEVPEVWTEVFVRADANGDGLLDAVERAELLDEVPPVEDPTAAPPAGVWAGTASGAGVPEGEGGFTLTLARDEDGALSGELTCPAGEGSVDGSAFDEETGRLTFTFASDLGELSIAALVEGDGLSGTVEGEGVGSLEITAEREQSEEEERAERERERAERDRRRAAKEREEAGPTIAELLPKRMWISSLEASRHEEERVYACFDGHRSDDDRPWLFASEDRGRSWRCLSEELPRGSSRVLREDRVNPDLLYLGTEFSMWVSLDRGASWAEIEGLPTVAVHEIAQHPLGGDVVVGTHGRSLWAGDVTLLRQLTADNLEADFTLFDPRDSILWGSEASRGSSGLRRFVGDNPAAGMGIAYRLKKKARSVSLTVTGLGGDTVAELEAPRDRGPQRVVWDLRRSGEGAGSRRRRGRIEPGAYRIVLEVDGVRQTRDVEVRADPDRAAGHRAAQEEEERRARERAGPRSAAAVGGGLGDA